MDKGGSGFVYVFFRYGLLVAGCWANIKLGFLLVFCQGVLLRILLKIFREKHLIIMGAFGAMFAHFLWGLTFNGWLFLVIGSLAVSGM